MQISFCFPVPLETNFSLFLNVYDIHITINCNELPACWRLKQSGHFYAASLAHAQHLYVTGHNAQHTISLTVQFINIFYLLITAALYNVAYLAHFILAKWSQKVFFCLQRFIPTSTHFTPFTSYNSSSYNFLMDSLTSKLIPLTSEFTNRNI